MRGSRVIDSGGAFAANYSKVDDLAGENGPQQVNIVDFPHEAAARSLFDNPEYQAVIPLPDQAFTSLNMVLAHPAT